MNWTLVYIISSLLILPLIIYGVFAQANVSGVFNRLSKVSASNGETASETAKKMLKMAGISNVEVVHINGNLSDCYHPKYKVVKLSNSTYSSTSIAAIGVCAHEVGHAIQDAKGSFLFKLRNALVPVCNFISGAFIPLIFIGSILSFTFYIETVGFYICVGSMIAYGSSLLFQIVTLPLEYDASNKALALMKNMNEFSETELKQAKQVLTAAIHTYISSMLTTLVYFLRFLSYTMIFSRDRD